MRKKARRSQAIQASRDFWQQGEVVQKALGFSGLFLGGAGGICGFLLAWRAPERADTVLQTAMTPVAVVAAAVLAVLVPARIRAIREDGGPQQRILETASTCTGAVILAFVSTLVALGVPSGAYKAGGTVSALYGVGLVMGSFITLISRVDDLRRSAPEDSTAP